MFNADQTPIDGNACPCCGANNSTRWMQVPKRPRPGSGYYDLLRCYECQHTWLKNPPTPDEMGQYYGPEYHRLVGSAGESSPVRWKRQLKAISQYKTEGAILDIGCSSGGFLSSLKNSSWKLYGIEASPATAERARTLTGGEIIAGDVIDASFEPESFDVIACSDVMEHLYDPRRVFEKVYGWLKPGGIFYVFVPNIMSWEAQTFRTHWYGLDLPRHLHHYSRKSLSALARFANLRLVRIVTPAGCYLEQSASILLNNLADKHEMKWKPIDMSGDAGLMWRVIRKGLRLSAEAIFSKAASCCGSAASIQVVFQKPIAEDTSTSKKGPHPSHRDGSWPGQLVA